MFQKIKPLLLLLLLIGIILVVRHLGLDAYLVSFKSWVSAQGALAPVIFVLAYALATVLAFPGSALSIMAGVLFGSVLGIVVVLLGATLGASLCFLLARYVLRDSVERWLNKHEKFQKFDEMTSKNGPIIVAITRLIPLFPFNMLNYGFGLTKVPFITYFCWTFICIIPGTALYVVGTDAIATSLSQGQVPWLLIGVVLCVLAILTVLVRKAKQSIKE